MLKRGRSVNSRRMSTVAHDLFVFSTVASTSHSLWGCSALSFQLPGSFSLQRAHAVIQCGFNVARLPQFCTIFLFENLLFNKAVQGRPVGLNTERYEPAGVTDNTNGLFCFTIPLLPLSLSLDSVTQKHHDCPHVQQMHFL